MAASAGLAVSPASITNSFEGAITLTVTGLDLPGQTVIVEKFFDNDGSNSVTAGDLLEQRFKVTDGQVTSLAGRRNLNVPGDEDGSADGSIQTRVYLANDEILGRLDGRHIFRVSPDGAGFAPATADLVVTQQDHGGSGLDGKVMVGAAPQPGALVLIARGASEDFDIVGITLANGTGDFSITLPPGSYRPIPVADGLVHELTGGAVTAVAAGSFSTSPNALLAAAGRTISGTVREGAPPFTGLAGMIVFGQSESGGFGLAFSDAAGNYSLPAKPEACGMGVVELPLAILGLMGSEEFEESSTGNVTGFNIDLPRATALIHGRLSTPALSPLPYVMISGEAEGSSGLRGSAITDANGDYTLGVDAGSWRVEVDSAVPGYLVVQKLVTVNSAGSAVLQDLTAHPITAHLRGHLRDNLNNPLPNVEILAHDYQGSTSWSVTDANGDFEIGAYGGDDGSVKVWSIQLNQGGDDSLEYVTKVTYFDVVDGTDINGIDYQVHLVTAHLRGQVLDENDAPVGGLNINAGSNDFINGTNVQGDGSFDIPIFAGNWNIGLSDNGLGLLPQTNLQVSVVDGADQNGLIFRVRHTTGTFSGSVKNTQDTGLGGVQVFANITVSGISYGSSSFTDGGGNYSLPVFAGTWSVGVVSSDLQNRDYQPVDNQDVFINGGNVMVNFIATANAGQSFDTWRAGKFTVEEIGNSALSGPQADFDMDGISNLMEYALNLEPKVSDVGGLPVPGRLPGWLTLTFTRITGDADLTYQVMESTNPAGPWINIVAPLEQVSSSGATETMRAKISIDGTARKFMRLRVLQGQP